MADLKLTDVETCDRVLQSELIQSLEIEVDCLGFEPEINCEIAHYGARIDEIGISYSGRTYEEGKKIGWGDGVRAIYSITIIDSVTTCDDNFALRKRRVG